MRCIIYEPWSSPANVEIFLIDRKIVYQVNLTNSAIVYRTDISMEDILYLKITYPISKIVLLDEQE